MSPCLIHEPFIVRKTHVVQHNIKLLSQFYQECDTRLCTDTWWITIKNLFNLFILRLWEGWIMLPVIWTVEFTILFLQWIFCAITMSSVNGTQFQIWWSCDTMIRHHNVTTPFAFKIKAEYELNIYFMISYNLKTCFFFLMSGVWWVGQSGHLPRKGEKTEVSLRIIVMCNPPHFSFSF